jgi:Ner family transcriptional regulator
MDSATRKILKDPRKRRGWIIYQLTLQGRSLASVARDAGVKRQTLYQVFHIRYPRMEKILADVLGLTPQLIFPERYDENGLPLKERGGASSYCHDRKKDTMRDQRCNANQKVVAQG